ncbi:phospholipid carrier-dependent glycosyltransferase [bacterium]|nr:MAG: phospholipid carrier-dependent glycosyltransferase [bacterium]
MEVLRKRYVVISFIFLIAISLFLHLWRISLPPRPVFDEAYFTTFPAKNVLHEPYFDIHPPLGRLILSLPLYFYDPGSLKEADYIKMSRNSTSGIITTDYEPANYQEFPFVILRLVSILFGLLFLSALFLFVREVAGDNAGLLALFFAVFENALLLHTRLVLMDGMFMAFSLLGLYFFFRKKTAPVLGGLLWGLALSVKLTALAFVGPVLVLWMLAGNNEDKRKIGRNVLKYLLTAFITLFVVWFSINSLLFGTAERMALLNNLFDLGLTQSVWLPIILFAKELILSFSGYVFGGTNYMMSPWYLWPFMGGVMHYNPSGLNIALLGNIFVWYVSTIAVIAALIRYVRAGVKRIGVDDEFKPALILLGGYVFSLVPFFTAIQRATHLYHYFPALTFAISLAAFLIVKFLKNKTREIKIALFSAIVILTVLGFVISAPYTYGL